MDLTARSIFSPGLPGWGISWYVDGVLIPELIVQRNMTYTFIVEGGTDAQDLSRYHPFYITNSINGGRLQNTQEQRDVSDIATRVPTWLIIIILRPV